MMLKRYFLVEVCGSGFHIPTDDGRKTGGFVFFGQSSGLHGGWPGDHIGRDG